MKSLQNRFSTTLMIFSFLVTQIVVPGASLMPQMVYAEDVTDVITETEEVVENSTEEETQEKEVVTTEGSSVPEDGEEDVQDPLEEIKNQDDPETSLGDDDNTNTPTNTDADSTTDEVVENTPEEETVLEPEQEVVTFSSSAQSSSSAKTLSLPKFSHDACFYALMADGDGDTLEIKESSDAGEVSLIEMAQNAGYTLDEVADQKGFETWKTVSDKKVTLRVTLIGKEAFYGHEFGFYTAGDVNDFTPLGRSVNSPVSLASNLFAVGDSTIITLDPNTEIGFALTVYDETGAPAGTFATEPSENVDGGMDHTVIFEVSNGYIIGFEDHDASHPNLDEDYNDLVILVEVIDCEKVKKDVPPPPPAPTTVDLAVSKTASVATTTINTPFTYTISVTNHGPATATNVSVTDTLPSGVSYVSATSTTGTYATSTGIWTIGTLAKDTTATLTLSVKATTVGEKVNTAVATSTETDTNIDNNTDTAVVTVIKKSTPPPPPAPQCIDTILAEGNRGPITLGQSYGAHEKTLPTILADNGYIVATTTDQKSYETWVSQTQDVVYEVKLLGKEAIYTHVFGYYTAGTSKSTFMPVFRTGTDSAMTATSVPIFANGNSTTINISAGHKIGFAIDSYYGGFHRGFYATENTLNTDNQADHVVVYEIDNGYAFGFEDLSTLGATDEDYNDVVVTVRAIACEDPTSDPTGIDLAVSKTASVATTTINTPFTYTIAVSNNGPETAEGVTVTDVLDANLTFVSATTTLGTYATSTGMWTIGDMTASQTETLEITVTASTTGTFANTATATSTGNKTDNDTDNNEDTSTVIVEEDLQCVVSDTNLIQNGSFESVEVTHDSKWNIFDSGIVGWNVVWNTAEPTFKNLNRPESKIEIQKTGIFAGWTAHDGAQFAELDSDWDGPDGVVNGEPALSTIYQDVATFPGAVYELSYAYAGRPSTYAGAADNKMDISIDGVSKKTHTVSSTTPGVLEWNTDTISFVATDTTTRVAFVGQGPSNSHGMLLDAVSLVIASCEYIEETGIDLAVSKTASVATTTINTPFTYTIAVSNNGPETAEGVTVTDVLDANLTFVSATTTLGTYATSTGMWTIGDMTASQTETLEITVTASTTGTFANTATATSTGDKTDNDTDNDSDTVDVVVETGGTGGGETGIDLVLTKTASISEVSAVDVEYTYTITVGNNGPDVAEGVEVTDVLPGSVSFVSATSSVGTYATSTGIWSAGDIAPNDSETLTLVVKTVSVDGDIVNTATGTTTTDQTDNNPDNNSSTHTVTIADNNGGGGSGGSGGGGSSGGSGGGGTINVVSTPDTTYQCEYLKEFMRYGDNNNPIEVIKLQSFLNAFEGETLTVDGFFDLDTDAAVRRFQVKYFSDILEPWGHEDSTGYVYILTKKKVNEIFCQRAFPVTASEADEIVAFRAFLESLRARGVDTQEFEGGIGGNPEDGTVALTDDEDDTSDIREFFRNLFGGDTEGGDTNGATTTEGGLGTDTEESRFVERISNLASAALVFPGNMSDAIGCLIVLLIILAIIYILSTVIVNGMSDNRPIEVVRGRKIIAFMVGVVVAIIIALLVPYPCIIIPLLLILIALAIWWAVRRDEDKPKDLNKEFTITPDSRK